LAKWTSPSRVLIADEPLSKQMLSERNIFLGVDKSPCHRDAVLKRAMADPRMKMYMSKMPFGERMIYGGFKTFLAM
jgi:uncharacterized protein YbaA (DUF1428 family)